MPDALKETLLTLIVDIINILPTYIYAKNEVERKDNEGIGKKTKDIGKDIKGILNCACEREGRKAMYKTKLCSPIIEGRLNR